jgi:hypothetical protein
MNPEIGSIETNQKEIYNRQWQIKSSLDIARENLKMISRMKNPPPEVVEKTAELKAEIEELEQEQADLESQKI